MHLNACLEPLSRISKRKIPSLDKKLLGFELPKLQGDDELYFDPYLLMHAPLFKMYYQSVSPACPSRMMQCAARNAAWPLFVGLMIGW